MHLPHDIINRTRRVQRVQVQKVCRTAGKMFASSYFYAPTHPTVEDQVELARRISHSLSDAKNMKSKGQSMYVNRKKRSVKWIHDGNGEYRCTCVLHALINLWISCISWTRHRRADTMHIDVHRLHDMLQIFFHNRSILQNLFQSFKLLYYRCRRCRRIFNTCS